MKAFSLLVSISKMFFWESSIRVWGQYPQLTPYVYLFNFLLEETFIALVNFRSQSQFQSRATASYQLYDATIFESQNVRFTSSRTPYFRLAMFC